MGIFVVIIVVIWLLSVASIPITLYLRAMNSLQRKAKINWNCRRGMLELDLIFERFSKKYLDTLSNEQLLAFENLLSNQDPDLYAWLMGYEEPTQKELHDIVTFIRLHDSAK